MTTPESQAPHPEPAVPTGPDDNLTPDDLTPDDLTADDGSGRRRGKQLSRLLRVGFLVLVFALAAYWVWRNRHQVAQALHRVDLLVVLAAIIVGAAAAWSGAPAWRELLAGLGSPLPMRAAQRVYLMGQLGKYIPGGVWTVLAQATMARELHVPRARSGAASLLSILLAVVTAVVLGGVLLLISGSSVLGGYAWLLLLVLPLLALLHPEVLFRTAALAGRLTHRQVPLERLSGRSLLRATGWLALGQVFVGAHFYLLVASLSDRWGDPFLPAGLFLLAAAAGIVVVIAPAGAGPRELILGVGLSGVLDAGSVVLAVLLSRLVLTIADVGVAGLAAAGSRRAAPAPAPGP